MRSVKDLAQGSNVMWAVFAVIVNKKATAHFKKHMENGRNIILDQPHEFVQQIDENRQSISDTNTD